MLLRIISLLFVFITAAFSQNHYPDLFKLIHEGKFTEANKSIVGLLSGNPSPEQVYEIRFAGDLMNRIKLDFRKKSEDVIPFIKKYYPKVTAKQISEWEELKDLEYKIMDGEKFYFNQAARNLFRVNTDAKQVMVQKDGPEQDNLEDFLRINIPAVIRDNNFSHEKKVHPVVMELDYTVSVKRGVVPAGEIIRCWMPFPRVNAGIQKNIELVSVNDPEYILAPDNYLHSSVYLEKPALSDTETVFNIKFKFTSYSEFNGISFTKESAGKYDLPDLEKFISERPPHIVFTSRIKKLSESIIGSEKDPVIKAKKIYDWINDNIPWASAREYSTVPNISDYVLENLHGDCGMQTLLFMTLCRYNGIPAQWQSGWMLHPGSVNLHDWCRINLPGYGWVPVDMSYGRQPFEADREKYFFFGNNDSYHMVVNDEYSADFYPAKIYPRSETVDFQRGEVEWKGGNLYFDKWNYSMDVKYIDENEK